MASTEQVKPGQVWEFHDGAQVRITRVIDPPVRDRGPAFRRGRFVEREVIRGFVHPRADLRERDYLDSPNARLIEDAPETGDSDG